MSKKQFPFEVECSRLPECKACLCVAAGYCVCDFHPHYHKQRITIDMIAPKSRSC